MHNAASCYACSVVSLFVTTVSPTKTDERIQMPLECKLTGAGGQRYDI